MADGPLAGSAGIDERTLEAFAAASAASALRRDPQPACLIENADPYGIRWPRRPVLPHRRACGVCARSRMIQRRTLIRFFLSFIAWGAYGRRASGGAVSGDTPRMLALACAVLPVEIGLAGRELAVGQFTRWLRDYRADAELDHEYGSSTLSRTPTSPARGYAAQLDDLDRRCGGDFAVASFSSQQHAVTAALVAAGVRELPPRPDGGHVATDLMAYYFNGPAASDLAYRHSIGRFDCRGLEHSEQRPPAMDVK